MLHAPNDWLFTQVTIEVRLVERKRGINMARASLIEPLLGCGLELLLPNKHLPCTALQRVFTVYGPSSATDYGSLLLLIRLPRWISAEIESKKLLLGARLWGRVVHERSKSQRHITGKRGSCETGAKTLPGRIIALDATEHYAWTNGFYAVQRISTTHIRLLQMGLHCWIRLWCCNTLC